MLGEPQEHSPGRRSAAGRPELCRDEGTLAGDGRACHTAGSILRFAHVAGIDDGTIPTEEIPPRSRRGRMERPGIRPRRTLIVAAFSALVMLGGCATLRQIAALRDVDFSLAGTAETTLAGVSIQSVRNFNDLTSLQVARLGAALAQGTLPFQTVLQVEASNPADNVQARLVELDWTLFLDDKETVSGQIDQEYVLPPGQPVIVPVPVQLDLRKFFDEQLDGLVNLAIAASGQGGTSRIRLEATPSIQTPLGPIHYPEPIRIEEVVGG